MIHTYRNPSRGRLTPVGAVIWAAFWLFFPAAILYGLISEGDEGSLSGAAWWFGSAGLLALCILWSWPVYDDLFRRCYEIQIVDDGTCVFRSPLRRTRLQAHEIISLYPARWELNDESYTVLRYRGGKRFIVQPVEGFSDFVERLRAMNPNVELHRLERPSFIA